MRSVERAERAGLPAGNVAEEWFLVAGERGNPDTRIDGERRRPWSEGNACTVLVHGRTYFDRLAAELAQMSAGDQAWFTDWRGDADERVSAQGLTIADELVGALRRGASVHGLLWRSHPAQLRFSERQNMELVHAINIAGGSALVDERVRRGGSHHQKLVVLRRPAASRHLAFVGGIDLAHGRRDDEQHRGDPQGVDIDRRYGPQPAWHDLQIEIEGPAVGDLEFSFRERWNDPEPLTRTPWGRYLSARADQPRRTSPLPDQLEDPPPAGQQHVQVLRTYPSRHPRYAFARRGERSVARAYLKAFRRARKLIYIEDQYLWSLDAAEALADALRSTPTLHVVVIVPAFPDQDGRVSGAANRVNQLRVLSRLADAGGDRFAAFNIERDDGVPIYVHAKVCIIDDVWMMAGSDNFNRRSWTHDSELSVAILDQRRDGRAPTDPGGLGDHARVLPRSTRLELWSEHLQRSDVAVDPHEGKQQLADAADALDAWYVAGRAGPRPDGRLRRHRPDRVAPWARPFAEAFYRLMSDPDGRPLSDRRHGRY
ncbi:MAG: phospholipase [Acidimicrobiales bacterium]|nr:phospholipase [Acidimicrobiales bacterium]